jgi:hypothetical protein
LPFKLALDGVEVATEPLLRSTRRSARCRCEPAGRAPWPSRNEPTEPDTLSWRPPQRSAHQVMQGWRIGGQEGRVCARSQRMSAASPPCSVPHRGSPTLWIAAAARRTGRFGDSGQHTITLSNGHPRHLRRPPGPVMPSKNRWRGGRRSRIGAVRRPAPRQHRFERGGRRRPRGSPPGSDTMAG